MASKVFHSITTVPATGKCTGAIIVLHESKSADWLSKMDIKRCLGEDLSFPHLKIHYLSTDSLLAWGYSPHESSHKLYSFESYFVQATGKNSELLKKLTVALLDLIDEEVQKGIPLDRIIIGGFSEGGTLSLHLGLRPERRNENVGGIFCLSSYFPDITQFFTKEGQPGEEEDKSMNVDELMSQDSFPTSFSPLDPYHPSPSLPTKALPAVFVAHGVADYFLPVRYSINAVKKLTEYVVKAVSHFYPKLGHETSTEELMALKDWILSVAPMDKS